MKKQYLLWTVLILGGLAITIANAGNLGGSGSAPAATFYTLQNICDRLTNNTAATEALHSFIAPTGTPAGTQCTLSQIYDLIPDATNASKIKNGVTYFGIAGTYPSVNDPLPGDTAAVDAVATDICVSEEAWNKNGAMMTGTLSIDASKIVAGNTLCGVSGTANKNMFNGTGQGSQGGATGGGVDDYNKGGQIPSDRYACQWTACNAGNNYCGTGAVSADVKDECTGMIFSKACAGIGCATLSNGTTDIYYSWDSLGANNGSLTAAQLCAQGTHGQSGWYLPGMRQLLQAYVDGFRGNAAGVYEKYWTGTAVSEEINEAWLVNPYKGESYQYTFDGIKSGDSSPTTRVICVRFQ